VGSKRPYRSTLREEHAQQTRRRILESSAKVFSERGYANASLADIARNAAVSVESVKAQGPKRALLLSAFELAFGGEAGESSLAERPEVAAIAALDDHERMLAEIVRFVASANARTSSLWATLTAAARGDAQLQETFTGLLSRRHADYRALVDLLASRTDGAPANLDEASSGELADALSFVMSPEGYRQLVDESGWSLEHYADWLLVTVRGIVARAGEGPSDSA
jgi:AcrR family transcriptional regulator